MNFSRFIRSLIWLTLGVALGIILSYFVFERQFKHQLDAFGTMQKQKTEEFTAVAREMNDCDTRIQAIEWFIKRLDATREAIYDANREANADKDEIIR